MLDVSLQKKKVTLFINDVFFYVYIKNLIKILKEFLT